MIRLWKMLLLERLANWILDSGEGYFADERIYAAGLVRDYAGMVKRKEAR